MAEKTEIFRKDTLKRINSPEKLNEYIRVSRPSVWVILCAVIILAVAAAFWSATAVIAPDGLRPIDFLLY